MNDIEALETQVNNVYKHRLRKRKLLQAAEFTAALFAAKYFGQETIDSVQAADLQDCLLGALATDVSIGVLVHASFGLYQSGKQTGALQYFENCTDVPGQQG